MNGRRRSTHRSSHHTAGRGSAVLLVLVTAFLCGGIAAWTPVPQGVAGFGFVVLFLTILAGGSGHRARRH
jgi:hypothetical protein